ncbi:hypothetical protein FALCPG4_19078 [Fusarium falciforme]
MDSSNRPSQCCGLMGQPWMHGFTPIMRSDMERQRTWATGLRPLGGQSPRSRQHPATPSSQSKPFKVFAGVEVVKGKVERDGLVACRYDTYLGPWKDCYGRDGRDSVAKNCSIRDPSDAAIARLSAVIHGVCCVVPGDSPTCSHTWLSLSQLVVSMERFEASKRSAVAWVLNGSATHRDM